MKTKLLHLLAFFLLFAVAAETFAGNLSIDNVSVVLTEKEEKSDAKDVEKEKQEAKDKFAQQFTELAPHQISGLLYLLSHTFFAYSVYLSLPELPPEKA